MQDIVYCLNTCEQAIHYQKALINISLDRPLGTDLFREPFSSLLDRNFRLNSFNRILKFLLRDLLHLCPWILEIIVNLWWVMIGELLGGKS